jgi:hypothetical protein
LFKKSWKGSYTCAFCDEKEDGNHLFFGCLTAKYIWSLLAYSLGTICRSRNLEQYLVWIHNTLPQDPQMHAVGLAIVCWAVWKTRNKVCFENKRVKSPTEIVCMMCTFLTYWAGMLKDGLKQQVMQGAEAMKMVALSFHKLDVQSFSTDDRQLIPYTG